MTQRKSSKGNTKKQPRAMILKDPKDLPPFYSSIRFTKTVRFQGTTGAATLFTGQNLLDLFFMAGTTILGERINAAVKLHRVTLWNPPTLSTNVPTTCSLEFQSEGGNGIYTGSNDFVISDTSMGADRPAHVSARPPKGSAADFWQSGNNTTNLFIITGTANIIVDIHATFVVMNNDTVVGLQNPVLVTATAGLVYCGGLDGVRKAGTLWPPLSYNNA